MGRLLVIFTGGTIASGFDGNGKAPVSGASARLRASLDELLRERGVEAGANVIMPNVTATRFRKAYKLYSNKPCLDETAKESRDALEARLAAIGEELLFGRRGDSPHFHRRTEQ